MSFVKEVELEEEDLPLVNFRLAKDLRTASKDLTSQEARFLVDSYQIHQKQRIAMWNRMKRAARDGEPSEVLTWFFRRAKVIERSMKGALEAYAETKPIGRWSMSIHGIGPVFSAGLLAYIDIERAPTVGHIWRFAGLDPTRTWKKGEKRPWNAALKRMCWLMGGSFVRLRSRKGDVYGQVYDARKAYEVEKNERGDYAELASNTLKEKNFRDKETLATYESGRLPDGRIELRARRYAVKLFLSHWHHVAYEIHFGKEPPKPYIIDRGGHVHFIGPPNWPMDE